MIVKKIMGALTAFVLMGNCANAIEDIKPFGQDVTNNRVVIELPQKEFLLGEPIIVMVGLRNDTNDPVSISSLHNNVHVYVADGKSKIDANDSIVCDDIPTQIAAHSTLWTSITIDNKAIISKIGIVNIEAVVEGTRRLAFADDSSNSCNVSIITPLGRNADALTLLRGTNKLLSRQKRSQKSLQDETIPSLAMIKNAEGIVSTYGDTVYGQYARLFLARSHAETGMGNSGEAATSYIIKSENLYQQVYTANPDSFIGTLAQYEEAVTKFRRNRNDTEAIACLVRLKGSRFALLSQYANQILSGTSSE